MVKKIHMKEETRSYKVTTHNDSDEVAEALRDLAEIIEVTGMVPKTFTHSVSGPNCIFNATLKMDFEEEKKESKDSGEKESA